MLNVNVPFPGPRLKVAATVVPLNVPMFITGNGFVGFIGHGTRMKAASPMFRTGVPSVQTPPVKVLVV